MPLALFREQMQELSRQGYRTILSEEYRLILEGRLPRRGKPILLTFDDWTADHYELVRPVLDRLGLRAVFFVITGKIDDPVENAKLKRLSAEGHEIASHSVHHYMLTQSPCDKAWKCCAGAACTESQLRFELTASRAKLGAILGKPVTAFAWPGNFFDAASMRLAREAGYKSLFAVERQVEEDGVLVDRPGVTTAADMIYRTEIDGRCGLDLFRKAVAQQRCCVQSKRKFYRHCLPQSL